MARAVEIPPPTDTSKEALARWTAIINAQLRALQAQIDALKAAQS